MSPLKDITCMSLKIAKKKTKTTKSNTRTCVHVCLGRTAGKVVYSSFSIILSSNSMNSLNWVYSDVSLK